MPAWVRTAEKAVVDPELVCGATIRPSIPLRLRALKKITPHLTIYVGHIPDRAQDQRTQSQHNRLEAETVADAKLPIRIVAHRHTVFDRLLSQDPEAVDVFQRQTARHQRAA